VEFKDYADMAGEESSMTRKRYPILLRHTTFLLLLCTPFSLLPLSALSADKVFIIGSSYTSFLSRPSHDGMLDRIAQEAFRRLGIGVQIQFLPTERSIIATNAGIIDVELNRIEGLERLYPNLVRVPESNMDFNFVAFSKERDLTTSGWSSLNGLRVGFVKGWKIFEEQLKDHPDITYVNSSEQLFRLLEKGYIDVALYGERVGRAQLKTMDITNLKVLSPPLAVRQMYMYVNKAHKDLVPDIAESLQSMKRDGTYDRIVFESEKLYFNGSVH
jgi:polar amino acid transport system substrate-binding protein